MSKGNSVVLNGVEIRYNDTRRDEGGVFNRIHIVFKPSQPVQEAMGWDDLPDSIPSGKLTGLMTATHVILTPTDKKLKQHELQFAVNEIRDFGFTSKADDEGNIVERTIKATVVTNEKIAALVENWLAVVGEASAVAKVGYTVQERLPGTDSVVDDKQKVLEMRKEPDAPVSDNDLNASGSGREKKKRTRGEMSQADAATAAELADQSKLAAQLEEQLQ